MHIQVQSEHMQISALSSTKVTASRASSGAVPRITVGRASSRAVEEVVDKVIYWIV
jgi:hypothetical protein